MITVTDLAREKVLEVMKADNREGDGLRIQVAGGGTMQVEYGLSFVTEVEKEETDHRIDAGGFEIHLDPEAKKWLEGASLDYIDGLNESGFKIDAPNAGPPRPEGPVAEAIQTLLNEQINPMVAAHGGVVQLEGVVDSKAYLRFGGGCQGCSQIDVTLKHGIESQIKQAVPSITEVIDVTDHANGTNPYYSER